MRCKAFCWNAATRACSSACTNTMTRPQRLRDRHHAGAQEKLRDIAVRRRPDRGLVEIVVRLLDFRPQPRHSGVNAFEIEIGGQTGLSRRRLAHWRPRPPTRDRGRAGFPPAARHRAAAGRSGSIVTRLVALEGLLGPVAPRDFLGGLGLRPVGRSGQLLHGLIGFGQGRPLLLQSIFVGPRIDAEQHVALLQRLIALDRHLDHKPPHGGHDGRRYK